MRQGDTLVICQLHRLGKSTRQLTELTQLFKDRGLHLVSIEEEIDTRDPMGKIYFQLYGRFSCHGMFFDQRAHTCRTR